jgi:hypothetical protein
VDGSGNVYVASYCISCNGAVYEMDRATPPTLNFPTPTLVGSTDTTDGTQTVQVQNIGNEALALTALSYPADFSEASGDASACTSSTSLSAGLDVRSACRVHPGACRTAERERDADRQRAECGRIAAVDCGERPGRVADVGHAFFHHDHGHGVAGTPFSITVTALTGSNSTATTYNGTVSFTSSDPDFVNPGPLTLSSGVGHATVTLETTGNADHYGHGYDDVFLDGLGELLGRRARTGGLYRVRFEPELWLATHWLVQCGADAELLRPRRQYGGQHRGGDAGRAQPGLYQCHGSTCTANDLRLNHHLHGQCDVQAEVRGSADGCGGVLFRANNTGTVLGSVR